MSNFEYLKYKGNAIFRNQPNHKYFDKPFEDEKDCLFQCLNEIEPHFLKPEQRTESLNHSNVIVTDPRTRKRITQHCNDHTQQKKTEIFKSPKKSMMTIKQHEFGVRVLSALQQCMEVEEQDMYGWYRLQKMRLKENQNFQKFVFDCNQSSNENMYKPCQNLLELYQKWYKSKITKLMKRHPERSYNTHLGLPQVRQCKNVMTDQMAQIIKRETISKLGDECHWHESMKEEFKKFSHSIAAYVDVYINSEDLQESLEYSLQNQFESLTESGPAEGSLYYIPLESLLFLLTAGDYVDIPSEMLLDIKETKHGAGDFKKYIIMEQPLPPRHAGRHIYQKVLQQATMAMVAIKQTVATDIENTESTVFSKQFERFKVFKIEDFMQKSKLNSKKVCRYSKMLTKWQLGTLEGNDAIQEIYSSFDIFTSTKELDIKLEFQPRFGCEVLTKYDMLKEWFKLKLLPTATSTIRLDVTNYQTLLEETLSLLKLEENLNSLYNINCKQLLNNLFEFLKILYNMPLGHYMLRFNPKFKDKLLLCNPSQEITQNTIHLHQLLQSDITETQFISHDFLPIDENLCSLMHLQHQVLPATFCPRRANDKLWKNKHGQTLEQKKPMVQLKELKKRTTNITKMKRVRRKKRLFETFKAEKGILREVEQLDRKMLNM